MLGDLLNGLGEQVKKDMERYTIEPDITYPLTIDGVVKRPAKSLFPSRVKTGQMVAVRPCSEEAKGKTFLGIYLGELPVQNHIALDKQENKLHVMPHCNPAMFVPDLNRIVWGMESWWGEIQSEEKLRQITDQDIQNVWYVKALKQLSESKGD